MKKATKRPLADLDRWLRKAKRVFSRGNDGPEQWDRGVDLARDIWRTLDPEGWTRRSDR